MKYFTYLTGQVIKDSKRHGLYESIINLSEKIEREQTDEIFQPYEPGNFRKKCMGRNFRLICYEKKLDDCLVICFLRIVSRSSKEYEKFKSDYNEFKFLVPDDNVLIKHLKIRNEIKPIVKKSMSKIENCFLFSTKRDISEGCIMILESYDWVKLMTEENYKYYIDKFFDIIQKIINKNIEKDNIIAQHPNEPGTKVIFRLFGKERFLFLIAPIINYDDKKVGEFKKKYNKFIKDDYVFNRKEILRYSVKAYPEIIAYEKSLWEHIQKDDKGNLALSPEEEEVLDSVSFVNENGAKYPLFINGRAGCGKSTILIYLFSDLLIRYLKCRKNYEELLKPPVFITYSDLLLKNVKEHTKKMLKSEYLELVESVNDAKEILTEIFDNSFMKFDDFILEQLGYEYKTRYLKERFIDFTKFKGNFKEYVSRNPDREIRTLTPELCWHIIRTYIKGMYDIDDNYLCPEIYSDLPRNIKTVSDETFRIVYQNIWNNWYKDEFLNKGFWDNQDIAREFLELNKSISDYPAVFCDEAQDFTRIELQLIFKLCLYSNRNVESNILKFIPFAFAGDPFQTINPTGFNWNTTKSNFYDKIIIPLDKFKSINLEFNFQELTYNYRSSIGIVQFCNLIQLVRGIIFDITDLKPQESWKLSGDVDIVPEIYKITDYNAYQTLREELDKGMIFIIPSIEGGKEEYIRNDTLLNSIIKNDEIEGNVLTPMEAKGLEFSKVIVYKFGQSYLDKFNYEFLDFINNPVEKTEEFLSYQYFINNLYVACSRAKNRLFIIDTEEGLKKFWMKIKNEASDILIKYIKISSNKSWNENSICEFILGQNVENIKKDPDNPKELALQFFEQGISNRDTDKLKLARQNFSRAKDSIYARLCSAYIYEFIGNYENAAKIFIELGKIDEALNCYWKGKYYSEIIKYTNENDPRHKASEFMLGKLESPVFINYLTESMQNEEFKNKFKRKYFDDDKWFEIFLRILQTTLDEIKTGKQIDHSILIRMLSLFEIDNRFMKMNEYADILFYLGEYEKAVNIWEANHLTDTINYYTSKEKITNYPDKIEWLYKLENYEQIFEHFVDVYNLDGGKRIFDYREIIKSILIEVIFEKDPETLLKFFENFEYQLEFNLNADLNSKILNLLIEKRKFKLAYKFLYKNFEDRKIEEFYKCNINSSDIKLLIMGLFAFIMVELKNNRIDNVLLILLTYLDKHYLDEIIKTELCKIFINYFLKADNDIKDNISVDKINNFISKILLEKLNIDLLYIGFCYEKIGNYNLALKIYNDVIVNAINSIKDKKEPKEILNLIEEDKKIAQLRIVKIKEKQYLMSNEQHYYEEAIDLLINYDLFNIYKNPSKIPDQIPFIELKVDFDKIFEENIQEHNVFDFIQDFDFKLNENEHILKIKDKKSDEIVLINYKNMRFQSEVRCDFKIKYVDDIRVYVYEFPTWNLVVRFNTEVFKLDIYSTNPERLIKSLKYSISM